MENGAWRRDFIIFTFQTSMDVMVTGMGTGGPTFLETDLGAYDSSCNCKENLSQV